MALPQLKEESTLHEDTTAAWPPALEGATTLLHGCSSLQHQWTELLEEGATLRSHDEVSKDNQDGQCWGKTDTRRMHKAR